MTVAVANNYNICKQTITNSTIHKTKQKIRNKIDDETKLLSSKLNLSSAIPIAPMSPQLQNVRSSLLLSQQQPSSSIHESKHSSRRSKRTSIATTVNHRQRQTNIDSSAANSPSTSPTNLSRSTSPAASIANFIRPMSPPCIQVKEPLSPKFSRASSTTITNYRHCSPPIANNIDASTASATTTLLIDDSSGYDSSENQNNRAAAAASAISTVPESCFEPETYRNLYPFNSSQQKKLSLSDPTLNQTTKLSRHSQQHQKVTTTTTNSHLSAASLQRQTSNEEDDVQTDDEIENLNSCEDTSSKEKTVTNGSDSRKVSSLCDLIRLSIVFFYLAIFKSSTSNDDMYEWNK
jgi:hypothetical protein